MCLSLKNKTEFGDQLVVKDVIDVIEAKDVRDDVMDVRCEIHTPPLSLALGFRNLLDE